MPYFAQFPAQYPVGVTSVDTKRGKPKRRAAGKRAKASRRRNR